MLRTPNPSSKVVSAALKEFRNHKSQNRTIQLHRLGRPGPHTVVVDREGLAYWPPGVAREQSLSAFIAAFATLQYAPARDGLLDAGMEKVVLYLKRGIPSHMAGHSKPQDGRARSVCPSTSNLTATMSWKTSDTGRQWSSLPGRFAHRRARYGSTNLTLPPWPRKFPRTPRDATRTPGTRAASQTSPAKCWTAPSGCETPGCSPAPDPAA
jgi:hypothetical protein